MKNIKFTSDCDRAFRKLNSKIKRAFKEVIIEIAMKNGAYVKGTQREIFRNRRVNKTELFGGFRVIWINQKSFIEILDIL